jgi:hypothetical protein
MEQTKEINATAGILAGGDGSARKKGVTSAAYGGGGSTVLATTVEYWQNKRAGDVQILIEKQHSCGANPYSGGYSTVPGWTRCFVYS